MEAVAQTNSSSGNSYVFGAKVFFIIVTSAPCCVFLIINATILYILRSKPMFTESPRYVLLFNLVFADTVLMLQGQTLYLLAAFQILISYPLCGFLAMISYLTNQISPLTLTVMSIERYISVCFPFRHSTVVTLRNAGLAILLTWTVSCVDVLTRILLHAEFPFRDLLSLQMSELCTTAWLSLGPQSKAYEIASACVLFVFSGLVIISSFAGVTVVARSASKDESSAEKAKKTLLLHMFQLGLSLISTLNVSLFAAASESSSNRLVVGKLYVVVYIFVILSPRCLSALTYGVRDQSIRPVLVSRLCCSVWVRVSSVRLQVTLQRTVKES